MAKTDNEWRSRMEDRIIKQGEDIASIKTGLDSLKEIIEKHIECQSGIDARQDAEIAVLKTDIAGTWKKIAIFLMTTIVGSGLGAFITKVIGLW